MTDEPDTKSRRESSDIGFPYLDLDNGIALARVVLERGAVPLDRDQLAAALGQVPKSGAFAIKLSTARMFGLIEGVQGKTQLTPLGFEILDSAREQAARAQAFLNVPLFRRAFEEFRGRQLPPRPAGLEQAFVSFGVVPNQKERARQVFDRSARQAGFFPTPAEDRLVQPVISQGAAYDMPPNSTDTKAPVTVTPPPEARPAAVQGGGYHPFIEGLLATLPAPKADWPTAERAKWLQAAAQIFDLLYSGGEGAIAVTLRDRD